MQLESLKEIGYGLTFTALILVTIYLDNHLDGVNVPDLMPYIDPVMRGLDRLSKLSL